MTKSLLIIEDETLLGIELKRHFQREGWRVLLTETLGSARRELFDNGLTPAVILSDMNLPDGNALDLLEEASGQTSGSEWIFLTGYGTVADSVRALRLGAYDYLEKPVDFDRLDLVISSATRSATAQRRLRDQFSAGQRRFTPDSFVGQSEAASQLRQMLTKLAQAPFSTLILTGETGTGKGVAARILHHSGTRQDAPMVEVNCSALPKDLLESELFGHEAGAFTGAKGRRRGLFEQADGGTLFLDEIGEMPVDLQAKLLKVIEEQCFRRVGGDREINVDVQLIAATNRNLQSCIESGDFREDLYHRLCVFELQMPPLRERVQDLDVLVPLLVDEFNAKAGKNVRHISSSAWARLKAHRWPGNVRELRNVIERCVLFSDDTELPLQWLQLQPSTSDQAEAAASAAPSADPRYLQVPLDGSMGLDEMDRFIISAVLERNQHNVTAAARLLHTTRDTLRYRIQKYGITLSDEA
jgi:DNA-binding NtrC family response regulator